MLAVMEYQDTLTAKSFARAAKLLMANPGAPFIAAEIAERQWGRDSVESAILAKAAVGAALTTGANWAGSLATAAGRAFVGAAAEIGIVGRVTQAPPNVNVVGVTTGASASFVAEGGPAPLTQLVLGSEALEPKRVVGALVISQELAKLSDPRADAIFERELRKAIVNTIDSQLLSTSAGSATTPPGLLDGLTPVTATSNATADIRDLVDGFAGDLTTAFFVADPKVMASLSNAARPLVGIRNGEILNAPAFVSRNAPSGALILIDADGVFAATGDIDVSVSTEASAIMADNPSAPGAVVSFWQSGLVGIRLSLNIDWAIVRPGSVAYISGAAW
jgi:hypothetical protein